MEGGARALLGYDTRCFRPDSARQLRGWRAVLLRFLLFQARERAARGEPEPVKRTPVSGRRGRRPKKFHPDMVTPTDTDEDSQHSLPDVKTGEAGRGWVVRVRVGRAGWADMCDPDMVTPTDTDEDSQQRMPDMKTGGWGGRGWVVCGWVGVGGSWAGLGVGRDVTWACWRPPIQVRIRSRACPT